MDDDTLGTCAELFRPLFGRAVSVAEIPYESIVRRHTSVAI